MRFWSTFLILCLYVGCTPKVSQDSLLYLNGYWEIKEVEFPDGNTKEYKVNTNLDYIKIDGLVGFRKKVQPKFDGTYITTDDAEPFRILREDETFALYYKNELSAWTERITSLSEDRFSVINEDNITYSYARYVPINAKE